MGIENSKEALKLYIYIYIHTNYIYILNFIYDISVIYINVMCVCVCQPEIHSHRFCGAYSLVWTIHGELKAPQLSLICSPSGELSPHSKFNLIILQIQFEHFPAVFPPPLSLYSVSISSDVS